MEQNDNLKNILIASIAVWILTFIGLIYTIVKINAVESMIVANTIDTKLNLDSMKEEINWSINWSIEKNAEVTRNVFEENEAIKVWWLENYRLAKLIYQSEQFKKTQNDSLQQAVTQFNEGSVQQNNLEQDNNQPNDWFMRWTLESSQISTILKDIKYEGKSSANIVLIEYSDVECPFCQRHFSSKTIDTVVAKYPDDIKTTYKHFPLSFHTTAQKAAEAIECAWKQNKYIEFKDFAFKLTIASNDKKPTIEILTKIAEYLKLDMISFNKCLESWETLAKVSADMNEGSTLFSVTWTPGNVLLNTKNGKYIVISGAYPADTFDSLVSEINQ